MGRGLLVFVFGRVGFGFFGILLFCFGDFMCVLSWFLGEVFVSGGLRFLMWLILKGSWRGVVSCEFVL